MIIKQSFGAGWLSITWSIAIEEQFYLLLPALIFILNRKILTITIIFLIITATILRFYSTDFFQLHVAFQCRMDSLFTGVLIAILFMNESIKNILKTKQIFIYFLFLILLTMFFLFSFDIIHIPQYLRYTLFNVLFGVLIIIPLLFKESWVAKILRNKALRKLGMVSYGIYLFHTIVINFIYWYLERIGVDIYSNSLVAVVAVVAFTITVLLAVMSYTFFESKLVRTGHWYKY